MAAYPDPPPVILLPESIASQAAYQLRYKNTEYYSWVSSAGNPVVAACTGSIRTSLGQHARIGIIAVLYAHTTVALHQLHPTTHSTLLKLTDLLHEDVAP